MSIYELRRTASTVGLVVVLGLGTLACGDETEAISAGPHTESSAVEHPAGTGKPIAEGSGRTDQPGPLTTDDAIERAINAADDPAAVDRADVRVSELSWQAGAQLVDQQPSDNPQIEPTAPIIFVTVNAPVTNTDVPSGAEPTTYDAYTVAFDRRSAEGFTICMGCDGGPRPISTTTTTSSA